jgi:hypothetical protein
VVSVACAGGAAAAVEVSGACAGGVAAGAVSRAGGVEEEVLAGGVSRCAAVGGVGRKTGFGVVTRVGGAALWRVGAAAGEGAVVRAGVESPRVAGLTLSATARPDSRGVTVSVEAGAGLTARTVSVAGASPVRRSPQARNIETPAMFSNTKHGRPPRMGSFLSGFRGPGGPTADNERLRVSTEC